jgi:S-adenosylmethionine:tRNA ribosyltransferase-isomerase
MLKTADLDYDLPESLIATAPAEPRDAARLLVVSRSDPARLDHHHIRDLPNLLAPRDLLILNTTRVVPARLIGRRADTGGRVEGLYLDEAHTYLATPSPSHTPSIHTPPLSPNHLHWAVLLQGKRMKAGIDIILELEHGPEAHASTPSTEPDLNPRQGPDSGVRLHLLAPLGPEDRGGWIASVHHTSDLAINPATTDAILDHVGRTPLPPYILKAREREQAERHQSTTTEAYDRARYQTVYAAPSTATQTPGTDPDKHAAAAPGASVAAPTAGLHLTPELLNTLASRGVQRADVTLHVGSGTFRPVETEFIEHHRMHTERCAMSHSTRRAIETARANNARVICVGTTSARTIESFARLSPHEAATQTSLATDILITPGYPWRWTDGLLTNFHLPRSTLLAMVASLFPEGVPRLMHIYQHALKERFRFYSYGDAMLILP